MLRRTFLQLLAATILAGLARAHGPTPQKVEEQVEIDAAPDAVWNLVKDFGNVAAWNTALKASKGEGSNATGETRTIIFASGGELTEGLDEINDTEKLLSWRLSKENIEVLPVSSYSAKIRVEPKGSGSLVTWVSRLYRGDTGNEPPENLNDEAAVKAMTEFVKAALAGLKAKATTKS